MSGISEIKQRLKSVRQTRQITNAMYLIAASRLRKAQTGIDYNILYMDSLRNAMRDILMVTKGSGIHNRYIDKAFAGRALFLALMGDKGLCGSYNSAVSKLTKEKMELKKEPELYYFGTIGKEKLLSERLSPKELPVGFSMHPSLETAGEITNILIDMYLGGKINEIYVVFTPYSRGERQPCCSRLLPLLRHDFPDTGSNSPPKELLYEPSAQEVFEHLVPLYCTGIIYDMLIQSSASENAARMEAMSAAKDNADKMIKNLRLQLNAERQLSVTNEITEIAAAAGISGGV